MMVTAHMVCMILALICFLLTALEINAPRMNLLGAGLFFFTLAAMV